MSQIYKSAASGGGVVTSVTGTNGVTAAPTTGAVVVSGVDATTTTVGVASFPSTYFSVTTGAVTPNPITVNGAGGITITGSPVNLGGTITITAGATIATTYTGNTGTATPAANNLNVLGTGSITVAATGSTLTAQLTGLTNHAVLVGAGTATVTNVGPTATTGQVLQSQGSGADPAFSTATYPSTTTINQILYSSSSNTVAGLSTVNNGALVTSAAGVPSIISMAANGDLLIGSASGPPLAATLTAGTGVTITNAANSITINATGGGFTWNDITGTSASMAIQNGYLSDNAGLVTLTLPTTAAQFSQVYVAGFGAGGWKVAQNASQLIHFESSTTTTGTGGSLASTNQYDSVLLMCVVANTTWLVLDATGNITVV